MILGNVGQLRRRMSKLERISRSGALRSCLRYLLSTKVVKVLVAALPTRVNTCIHRNIEICRVPIEVALKGTYEVISAQMIGML